MYAIVKNDIEIGLTEKPTFIKAQENGAYVICGEDDAQGVCYEGTVYHVWGKPEIVAEGVESVALVEFNAGARIRDQAAQIKAAQEARAMLEECLVEMAGIVYA